MNARSRRPSSRHRRRTRRQRCFGTRAFRLTRGSLLSPAGTPDLVLRGTTVDPPGSARSTRSPARLPPFLAGRTSRACVLAPMLLPAWLQTVHGPGGRRTSTGNDDGAFTIEVHAHGNDRSRRATGY